MPSLLLDKNVARKATPRRDVLLPLLMQPGELSRQVDCAETLQRI
jgi:ATP-dependent Zn protease